MKKFLVTFKFLLAMALVFALSATISSATGLPMAVSVVSLIALGVILESSGMKVSLQDATIVNSIAQWAGKYSKDMIGSMLNEISFMNSRAIKIYRNVDEHGILLPKVITHGGIRPQDTAVESDTRTNRTITGRKLFAYQGMKIITFVGKEVRKSFLEYAGDPKATELPMAQWFWQEEFRKIASEIEENFYSSTYQADAADWDAGDTYADDDYVNFENDIYICEATTTAGQSPTTHPAKWTKVNESVISDGWGTIIANEITATNITPVVTGAVSNTNAVAKVELIVADMSTALYKKGGTVNLSPTDFKYYQQNLRTTYGYTATAGMGDGKHYVFGTGSKWEVVEAPWLGDSRRIIASTDKNLAFGTWLESDMNNIGNSVPTLHGAKHVVNWAQGAEIGDLEAIKVSDQA